MGENKNILQFFTCLSLAAKESFFTKHRNAVIDSAVDGVESLSSGSAICIVCVVNRLEKDVNLLLDEDDGIKLTNIIEKSKGKTWRKQSKQVRHNKKSDHKIPRFCTTTKTLLTQLMLWRLGVLSIGGVCCTASDV